MRDGGWRGCEKKREHREIRELVENIDSDFGGLEKWFKARLDLESRAEIERQLILIGKKWLDIH